MSPDFKPYLYILDDEPDQAFLIELAAQRTGEFADVRTAIDAQLAYHHLLEVAGDPEHCPSLLLIDWKMPRMHGSEIAVALQAHPQLCEIPIVVLSNSDFDEDRELALRSGCKALYQKPATLEELMDILRTIRREFCSGATSSCRPVDYGSERHLSVQALGSR